MEAVTLPSGRSRTVDCSQNPVSPPKVCAVATDRYLTPTTAFADAANLGGIVPMYGQDITFNAGRRAPQNQSVGTSVAELKPKMLKLLDIFAGGDASGMARKLFNQFLTPQPAVTYFDDQDLAAAAARHGNITHFVNAAMGIPGTSTAAIGKTRIHQALRAADWDIRKLTAPTDLGVPAFNTGDKFWRTGDFNNGLGVMINGVQHAYVIATHYKYDAAARRYCIKLRYVLYDVFGLDDDDLTEYGAASDGMFASGAGVGITAWWQLQHQHSFAPLVTRIRLTAQFEAAAV